MAARTKVDLSDDPMASLFEDDFVPASKTAPAPVAQAAEEPELRALDFSKVAIKGAAARRSRRRRRRRRRATASCARICTATTCAWASASTSRRSRRPSASSAAGAGGGGARTFGGAAAAPAPDADADLFGEARAPRASCSGRGAAAAIDDLLVGKILEKEDFSGLAADDSLFGASDVKRAGAPPPPAARPDLDLGVLDKLDDLGDLGAAPGPRGARSAAPAAPAAPPPPAVDDFDFSAYIDQAQGKSGGGLFD
ncbi:DUF861-containing protein [Aureococcus anophagefferens]|nr:DUF861-containing protein [Aureococcus anophagefferens]